RALGRTRDGAPAARHAASAVAPRAAMFTAAVMSAWPSWPHSTHSNRAWVARFSAATCPHDGHVCEVWLAGTTQTLHPAPSALVQILCRSRPNAASDILRLSARFAATFVPGFSTVPFADRVMLASFRSSSTTTSELSTIWRAVSRAQLSATLDALPYSR